MISLTTFKDTVKLFTNSLLEDPEVRRLEGLTILNRGTTTLNVIIYWLTSRLLIGGLPVNVQRNGLIVQYRCESLQFIARDRFWVTEKTKSIILLKQREVKYYKYKYSMEQFEQELVKLLEDLDNLEDLSQDYQYDLIQAFYTNFELISDSSCF